MGLSNGQPYSFSSIGDIKLRRRVAIKDCIENRYLFSVI